MLIAELLLSSLLESYLKRKATQNREEYDTPQTVAEEM